MKIQQTEHQIQTIIMNYLQYKGWFVLRLNSGAIETKKGNMVRLARRGTPDLMAFKGKCIHHFEDHTELMFVEVKRPGNKPTFAQEQMMAELTEYGARCIIASSIEEVEKQL